MGHVVSNVNEAGAEAFEDDDQYNVARTVPASQDYTTTIGNQVGMTRTFISAGVDDLKSWGDDAVNAGMDFVAGWAEFMG